MTSRAEAKVIATRRTFDGKTLRLWSDGDLSWSFESIRGVRLPRNGDLTLGWAVLGEVEIVDAEDVPLLIKAAQQGGLPGEIRARFHEMKRRQEEPAAPRVRLDWEVLETDRDGRVKARVARLPRMLYGSGMAIWNERGLYELMREMSPPGSETFTTTGIRSRSLNELLKTAIVSDGREM